MNDAAWGVDWVVRIKQSLSLVSLVEELVRNVSAEDGERGVLERAT